MYNLDVFQWDTFTLFLYIMARMSGFVLFNPIFGRNGLPAYLQIGFVFMLSETAYFLYDGSVLVPNTFLQLVMQILLELLIGLLISFIMRFFFYIPEQAGEIIDTQMGMSMARSYDPSSNSSMTSTANFLNTFMMILFFSANGHITLLRLILTSGEIVPFGTVSISTVAGDHILELFAECALLSIKLGLPILGAELLGQVGMGILMKAIPQINVFAINIELKVLIGFFMLSLLITPISSFLLDAENTMLNEIRTIFYLTAG